jgi:hypothetical protein
MQQITKITGKSTSTSTSIPKKEVESNKGHIDLTNVVSPKNISRKTEDQDLTINQKILLMVIGGILFCMTILAINS